MAFKDLIWLLTAGRPDRNPRVRSGGCHSSILQESDRVDCIRVEAKDLLCGFRFQRPSDSGRIETTGKDAVAIA
jgi:hypothetical protein